MKRDKMAHLFDDFQQTIAAKSSEYSKRKRRARATTIVALMFGRMVEICGLKENPKKKTLIS